MSIECTAIDFNELVNAKENKLTVNFKSKFVDLLKETFTDEEQKWFISNFYAYINFHPTEDFPVNLEKVFKMIGYANKGNAKRTLENNFTENEDYKVTVIPSEKQLLPTEKQLLPTEKKGGSGLNKEIIMLNVDTFKNICMLARTDKGKAIRSYYIKLERVYNTLIDEQRKQYDTDFQNIKKELEDTIVKTVFDSHLRVHANEKIFQCGTCENAYFHQSHLLRHMEGHNLD